MIRKLLFIGVVLLLLHAVACKQQDKTTGDGKIKVGVFDGNGASPICVLETLEALKIDTDIEGMPISSVDIMRGKLDSIDVLIFPGGSGSKELNNLGDYGAEKVKEFVNGGKSIVGICAGGYILSTTPTYPSLQIASAKNIDRKHYQRGRGLIEASLTSEGLKIFPELKGKKVFLQYYDGPILAPLDSNDMKYTEIGRYVTDIHANKGIPSGITPGKTIMLTEKIGDGRIFIVGGHPEATPGMRWMVPRMVRYCYDGKIVDYSKWVHPENYDTTIMFTSDLRKIERKYMWDLYNDTAEVKITAMEKLHEIHSRPAVRWTIGLLRDENPQVRREAAIILRESEYTAALPDVIEALEMEKNENVKTEMQKTVDFLSRF